MKIINKGNFKKHFSDLCTQDLFHIVDCEENGWTWATRNEEIWMKTNNLTYVNAVCLSTGLCSLFKGNEEVIGPITAELHIL